MGLVLASSLSGYHLPLSLSSRRHCPHSSAIMAPADFNGKWKLEKQENFDEYLTKLSVGLIKRKMAVNMYPTQDVNIDGDTISIKNSLGKDVLFTIGVEFEQETPVGDKFTGIGSWEGDKLVTKGAKAGEDHITYREVVGEEFIMTIIFGDLTCKRIFKRA